METMHKNTTGTAISIHSPSTDGLQTPRRSTLATTFAMTLALGLGLSQEAHAQTVAAAANVPVFYGDRATLGTSTVRTYVQRVPNSPPVALGVEFGAELLPGLPPEPNDGSNCWDVDEDGTIELEHECVGGQERALFFPPEAAGTPIKWLLFNWDSHGHIPAGIYDSPHIDLHFFMQDYISRNMIRPGPCGLVINCDDYQTAKIPVPAAYMPRDYIDIDAIEARMGAHMVDPSSPELQPGGKFTKTFIYGHYNGHMTFYEPMIDLGYLLTQPNTCTPLKLPAAYETAGYYPTQYCMRYAAGRKIYTISLEGFVYRSAS